jgi:hypothetical protein
MTFARAIDTAAGCAGGAPESGTGLPPQLRSGRRVTVMAASPDVSGTQASATHPVRQDARPATGTTRTPFRARCPPASGGGCYLRATRLQLE